MYVVYVIANSTQLQQVHLQTRAHDYLPRQIARERVVVSLAISHKHAIIDLNFILRFDGFKPQAVVEI